MKTKGIHHVTAISGDMQGNLDFYVGILGLRLAKRTVIQEEPSTYHLFYGDAAGSVGTGLTFFDWPHVGRDRAGARNVVRTFYSVAHEEALAWWQQRFERAGVAYTTQRDFAGRGALYFADPEGQRLGLVAAGTFGAYHHWDANAAPRENALQAINSVTLGVDRLEPAVRYLCEVFGYAEVQHFDSPDENEGNAIALRLGDDGASTQTSENFVGKELIVVERSDAQPGLRGIGSVHHVALTVGREDSIEAWHTRLVATGLKVSEIMRRYYFDSIYVRIPGGIQFELATEIGAGLAADEEFAHLGQRLSLPPFLEARREEIETKLKPIVVPEPKKF